MSKRKNKGGYTLVEATLVLTIMGFVAAGAMALMVGSFRCFDSASVEAFTDADAVIAMQVIVNDVREAKSVSITDGGQRLVVVFPRRTEEGYYDRREPDTENPVEYYLSDETGQPNRTGTCLWRVAGDGTRKLIKRDIVELQFEQDAYSSRSVKITVVARNSSAGGPKETQLTQRVVYLRNY